LFSQWQQTCWLIHPRGHADVHLEKGAICIDDCARGAALFRLDNFNIIKNFTVMNSLEKEHRARTKKVVLTACDAVVCGSDHGKIYVFDRRANDNSDPIDEITIEKKKAFTSVAVE
jgi:hypothetical protein